MSRLRILWVISLLVSTIFSFPNLSLSAQERRTALVIGNGSYKSAPLRNPVNDAEDMAKALRKLGFTVIHKQNATQRDMETSIRKFGERLRKGGVGLFYYAGHGLQVNGINYIIPLDAEIREETDVKYEAVDARRVLDAMYNAGNDLNIVILDACRDNPLARGFRSGSSGLARMDAPKGTIVAYSTSPGKLAFDGKGRNSPYTAALVDYMDDPGLTIEQVFKKCRRRIDRATNGKQIPWESTSLTGDFYFSTKRNDNRFSAEQARLEKERREVEVASLPQKPSYSPPSSSTSNVIKRDGIYVAYANGIVKDTKTGLEWKAGPDEKTNWNEAKSWVQSLNLDGGGWRMPTTDELKGLYKKGAGSRNMTPLLKTTSWFVWSGETKGPSFARFFHFGYGNRDWYPRGDSLIFRAFAVRSRDSRLELSTDHKIKGKLFVQTDPKDSRVRILNIKPKFYQGMDLDSGSYRLEVSKTDYKTKKMWIRLGSGESKQLKIRLEQLQASIQPNYTPPLPTSDVIKRDGIYVAYANGIVKDTSTGLEWKVGPDKGTDWNEARSWVQSLNLDGGGWRLPTIVELKGLYKKGAGSRNMTPLLKTTGWGAWSSETEGPSIAWAFSFSTTGLRVWAPRSLSDLTRVFSVRSRDDGSSSEKLGGKVKPKYTSEPTSNVIKRDGIYVQYANGIVKDTKTGLEWKAGPDMDTNWDQARSWVQSLNLDGGGWRMPTMDEVASLYKQGAGSRNVTPLLKSTGWFVWSGETDGPSIAGNFVFLDGRRDWDNHGDSSFGRAFAVRSRSDG